MPLVSRNLNATVNAVGPSFEPVGRDYRIRVEDEAKNRDIPYRAAPEAEPVSFEESDDIGVLEENLKKICARISEAENGIVEASLNDDYSKREKLEKEVIGLRTLRDRTVANIKSLKSSGASMSNEQIERIDRLEDEVRSLRVQISMLREDIGNMMSQMDEVLDRLGISPDTEDEDEDF